MITKAQIKKLEAARKLYDRAEKIERRAQKQPPTVEGDNELDRLASLADRELAKATTLYRKVMVDLVADAIR